MDVDFGTASIIGFCGPAQCGKSYLAEALSRDLTEAGRTVAVLSFATPIKQMLSGFLLGAGVPNATVYRALYGDMKEVPLAALQGYSARHAMQTLGTEWGRQQIGQMIWADVMITRARQIISHGDVVIFDDVQFDVETQAIRQLGGRVYYVDNPNARNGIPTHSSEMTPVFDATVLNAH